jgi:hypothetical protein
MLQIKNLHAGVEETDILKLFLSQSLLLILSKGFAKPTAGG